MFREMRRKRQVLTTEESVAILKNASTGVLGLIGDGGYPYTVPTNYAYHDNKIFFHSAKSGHKIDAVKNQPKASFTVISRDEIVPAEFTDYFKSAIAFGNIRIIEDDAEKHSAIEALVEKYSPDYKAEGADTIEKAWNVLCILEFTIEHLSGKQAMELVSDSGDNP